MYNFMDTCIIDQSNSDTFQVSYALWLNKYCIVNDAFPIDCLTWEGTQ